MYEADHNLNRRDLLKSIGVAGALAASGGILGNLAVAEETEPPPVADSASSIRISDLQPHLAGDRVYVKIETNHNVSGWGEIKGIHPQTAATLVRSMLEMLKDENPTRIEHLWQRMYRSHRNQRGGAFMVHAISAVDMALWDIAGKLWKVPVYRLLGGPVRDSIRVYPTDHAVKLAPGIREMSSTPEDARRFAEQVRRAREKVGPDGAVMVDAHSMVPAASMIQLANAIEPSDVLFIEEPWLPGAIETAKKIRQAVRVPLATGERDRTIWGVLPYLHERVIDILQPDVGYTGGISQMRKIAALAEAYYVPLAPHNTQSYLGVSASFHVAATVPLFLIHECYHWDDLAPIARKHWEVDAKGYASLPEGVGLCVDMDEEAMALRNADARYQFKWPDPKMKDGSVADY